MTDQPKRHPSTKSTDTVSKREHENVDPAQSDGGIDLLATSNYPEGTTRPGPEDSADLFDSLAMDERTNSQVADSRPSPENEDAWLDEDESGILSELDQSSVDTDDYTAEQEYPTQAEDHALEKLTKKIAQNFDQESAAEKASYSDLPTADFDHAVADNNLNPSLEFDLENSESNDSVLELPAELNTVSNSTAQYILDDNEELIEVSETLQDVISEEAGVAEAYADGVDNSVKSNQRAESDVMHKAPSQPSNTEVAQKIPAESSAASQQTSFDIQHVDGKRGVQSDASDTEAGVLTYDNMLEESDEMRWFTIGMPILLVIVIIIMGGYVYSLQSQINEIHLLLSSEEEDFFGDEQSNGSVVLNESTLAHVNARIDNLADSVAAIASRAPDQTEGGSSGAGGRFGMKSVNKDLAILAERVQDLEDKVLTRPLVLGKTSKTLRGGTAKQRSSIPKAVSRVTSITPEMRNKSGVWAVNLMSVTEKIDAERQLKGFRDKGVAAKIQPKTIAGKQWYRIQVTGFDTKQEAKDYAASVKAKLAWPASG